MLGADEFGHLAHDDGSPLGHEPLHGDPNGRVRREPAGGVGTAAFEPEDQVAQGALHAPDPGGVDGHLLGCKRTQGNGLGSAALRLDADDHHRLSRLFDGLGHFGHIRSLAPQAHQDNGCQVRVLPQPDEGLSHPFQVGRGLAAALLVAEGDRPLDLRGNGARRFVGADHR